MTVAVFVILPTLLIAGLLARVLRRHWF